MDWHGGHKPDSHGEWGLAEPLIWDLATYLLSWGDSVHIYVEDLLLGTDVIIQEPRPLKL